MLAMILLVHKKPTIAMQLVLHVKLPILVQRAKRVNPAPATKETRYFRIWFFVLQTSHFGTFRS